MNLKKYTKGIIFIDDKKEEVKQLIEYCDLQGINTLYIHPDDFDRHLQYFEYRIVFADLAFNDGIVDPDRVTNIIRGISDNGEKHLLIVAWTQHEDDIEVLKNKLEEKMPDNLPIEVLNAQKSKLLSMTTEEDFNNLFSQIFDEFINKNKNLFNLLEWEECQLKAIREEFDAFIENSYKRTIDSSLIDKNLGLYAHNTLSKNILSAFEILNLKASDNALYKISSIDNFELEYDEESITFDEKFKFNYQMIFEKNINERNLPGSLYSIEEYKYEELERRISDKSPDDYLSVENLFNNIKLKGVKFDRLLHVLLNITPNCTYASKNKNTSYCEGYILYGIENYKEKYRKIKEIKGYSASSDEIYSLSYIDDDNNFSYLIICFDKCQSTIDDNYKKIAQIKNNIKINIQQGYSSWINRIGDVLYNK